MGVVLLSFPCLLLTFLTLFTVILRVEDGRRTLDALNSHRKNGSSAKTFWMHATAAGISFSTRGMISIAMLY